MPRARKNTTRDIDSYAHPDKERVNNPPVGLVTPDTDKDAGKKTYAYDPHLDPQLQWAGKAEHTSFAVPTVSLHVHERIDPRSIIEAVRKHDSANPQLSLFATPKENPPIRQAIEFYKHTHNWTNRLIAGDSLLVMNRWPARCRWSIIDPPYGITYKSNFQPFVNKRDVTDGRDEDLTQEPETIRAFRDTWELGIHSYLAYLRDRLLLARELLTESGSCFVQISDENLHHVRELMDEVFGVGNFISIISVRKTTSQGTASLLGATNGFHRVVRAQPATQLNIARFSSLEAMSRRNDTTKPSSLMGLSFPPQHSQNPKKTSRAYSDSIISPVHGPPEKAMSACSSSAAARTRPAKAHSKRTETVSSGWPILNVCKLLPAAS